MLTRCSAAPNMCATTCCRTSPITKTINQSNNRTPAGAGSTIRCTSWPHKFNQSLLQDHHARMPVRLLLLLQPACMTTHAHRSHAETHLCLHHTQSTATSPAAAAPTIHADAAVAPALLPGGFVDAAAAAVSRLLAAPAPFVPPTN